MARFRHGLEGEKRISVVAVIGPLSTWIRGPPELLLRPRRVESLRVVRKAQAVRQATIQQTMPGSVRQPTDLESMPTAGLEVLAMVFGLIRIRRTCSFKIYCAPLSFGSKTLPNVPHHRHREASSPWRSMLCPPSPVQELDCVRGARHVCRRLLLMTGFEGVFLELGDPTRSESVVNHKAMDA